MDGNELVALRICIIVHIMRSLIHTYLSNKASDGLKTLEKSYINIR